jgi:type II secretory pathway pseudopilin PulG
MKNAMRMTRRRRGLSLVQLVVVLGVISMLATLLFNVFSDGRASARRAQCDAKLKTIALALDAHRQEMGLFPASLQVLRTKHFLHDEDDLHCPADVRGNGSYNDFYVIRAARDDSNLPTVVCPFHENINGQGTQAFKGNYTKQFMTRPAELRQASGATIERPGEAPVAAIPGTTLRGGDRIRTAAGGAAVIRFADSSESELQGNSDVTVLQSFVASTSTGTLYTMVRQTLGTVVHRVHHGSKFDVATPTATAGALGTMFTININQSGTGTLAVQQSKVALAGLKRREVVHAGQTVPLTGSESVAPGLDPDATPLPFATPLPTPTPCVDDNNNGGGNSGECGPGRR